MKPLSAVLQSAAIHPTEARLFASYGLPFLDDCPAAPGTLVVVGGRTGEGKSFFGLKLLEAASTPALYISCEDGESEVGRRATAFPSDRLANVWLAVPRRPRLSAILRLIASAFGEGKPNPRLILLDYIQLIQYDGEVAAWSQTDAIGITIAELKALGRELGFVLVLNGQLRRPSLGVSDSDFPNLWDLRDSANIENSAEVVILLHGPGAEVEVRVAKNKSGRRGAAARFRRGGNGAFVPVPVEVDVDLFGDGETEAYAARPSPQLDLFDETSATGSAMAAA